MSTHNDDDQGEIFLDDNDIIEEFTVDEEGMLLFGYQCTLQSVLSYFDDLVVASDLPDADEDAGSDAEVFGTWQRILIASFFRIIV